MYTSVMVILWYNHTTLLKYSISIMINEPINASIVEMMIHNLPMHTILKDAKSGKCLDINTSHLAVYGLDNPSDLIGYTVWDVNNFMNKLWLDNAKQVEEFDAEVLYTKKPLIKPMRVWLNASGKVWLNASGKVWAHYMSKIPVTNSKNEVIAILGSSQDLTATLSLYELYQHYCNFYQHKNTAIQMFLKHINIYHQFHTLPTHAEIMVLITKRSLLTNKNVALKLNITEGTVENHINKINDKLYSKPTQLRDFLTNIRITP
ncbi:MAG: hypothetical protein PHC75_01445 [Burkholderiales bacterium]|nr:hypothetical protein [Burkholderiales bacterium]